MKGNALILARKICAEIEKTEKTLNGIKRSEPELFCDLCEHISKLFLKLQTHL